MSERPKWSTRSLFWPRIWRPPKHRHEKGRRHVRQAALALSKLSSRSIELYALWDIIEPIGVDRRRRHICRDIKGWQQSDKTHYVCRIKIATCFFDHNVYFKSHLYIKFEERKIFLSDSVIIKQWHISVALSLKMLFSLLVAWRSGRTLVFDRRTFSVLCSTYSWRVTTYVGKPSAIGQPTRQTQHFILSGVYKWVVGCNWCPQPVWGGAIWWTLTR